MNKATVLCLVLMLAMFGAAQANTADEAAADFLKCSRNQDYTGLARLIDPDFIHKFSSTIVELVSELEQDDETSANADELIKQIFGPTASIKNITKMSDAEVFGAFMQAELSVANIKIKDMRIVGSVPEGDKLRHYVIRSKTSISTDEFNMNLDNAELKTFERQGNTWRLVVPEAKALFEQLENLQKTLEASDDDEPVEPAAEAPEPSE